MINLQNATIVNEKNTILTDVNFRVDVGEFVFLIGKTGTGKSSLLKLLYGDLPLHSGQGTIVGFDLNKLKDKEIPLLRRKLGVVFQDFKLLPDRTLFDNLSFVLKATGWKGKTKIKERVAEVLELVNVTSSDQKFPFELSGGEQQRVAIARAILKKPSIFLFDEATSALDSQTEKQIQSALNEVSESRTTLIIAHRLSTIVDCDEILVMREGQIAERGTHADLIAMEGLYAAMWARQASGFDIERGQTALYEAAIQQ